MALPTLADLKQHIGIPAASTADDGEMVDHLDSAVEMVEDIIGPLTSGPVTEVHRNVSSDALVLRRTPVTALVAVLARYGAATTTLTLSDYELDEDAGLVRLVSGGRFFGTYVVEYLAGRQTLPASVRLAVLIIAAHLWETQRMPMQSDAVPVGFGGGVDAAMPTSRGYALPNRALELLRPYAPQVSIA